MRNRNGFTLIELLVVIAIITILAGLLIPGVLRAMKQAKTNRALSEMQHLSTVITQIYSEVGYYVRLEDLVKQSATGTFTAPDSWVWIWKSPTCGLSDGDSCDATNSDTALANQSTVNMWNGPYTTYKSYYNDALQNYTGDALPISSNVWDVNSTINTPLTNAPLDPWGRPYRMFWIAPDPSAIPPETNDRATWSTTKQQSIPLGANGAMIIISAGGDGILQSLIGLEQRPTRAQQADFNAFDPNDSTVTEKDVYYIFNAGIQ